MAVLSTVGWLAALYCRYSSWELFVTITNVCRHCWMSPKEAHLQTTELASILCFCIYFPCVPFGILWSLLEHSILTVPRSKETFGGMNKPGPWRRNEQISTATRVDGGSKNQSQGLLGGLETQLFPPGASFQSVWHPKRDDGFAYVVFPMSFWIVFHSETGAYLRSSEFMSCSLWKPN